MAQWVKCFLCKLENLRLDPWRPYKDQDNVVYALNPLLLQQRQMDPPELLGQSVQPIGEHQVQCETLSQKLRQRTMKKTPANLQTPRDLKKP